EGSTPEVARTPLVQVEHPVDTPPLLLYDRGMRTSAAQGSVLGRLLSFVPRPEGTATGQPRGNALGLIAVIVLIPLGLSALGGSSRADEPDPNPDRDRSRGDR